MKELGWQDLAPFLLAGDNQGAIFTASNPVQEKRTKHIDICYHYINQVVEQGEVKLLFMPTNKNPVDMLMKTLAQDKVLSCRSQLGLRFI